MAASVVASALVRLLRDLAQHLRIVGDRVEGILPAREHPRGGVLLADVHRNGEPRAALVGVFRAVGKQVRVSGVLHAAPPGVDGLPHGLPVLVGMQVHLERYDGGFGPLLGAEQVPVVVIGSGPTARNSGGALESRLAC